MTDAMEQHNTIWKTGFGWQIVGKTKYPFISIYILGGLHFCMAENGFWILLETKHIGFGSMKCLLSADSSACWNQNSIINIDSFVDTYSTNVFLCPWCSPMCDRLPHGGKYCSHGLRSKFPGCNIQFAYKWWTLKKKNIYIYMIIHRHSRRLRFDIDLTLFWCRFYGRVDIIFYYVWFFQNGTKRD